MIDTITQTNQVSDLVFTPKRFSYRQEIKRDPRLKSKLTRDGYTADLSAFEKWRSNRLFTKSLVEEYAAELLYTTGKSPVTINRSLAAIRWYARKIAEHLNEIPALTIESKFERAELVTQAERVSSVRDLETDKDKVAGRNIEQGELNALIAACVPDTTDPTPCGVRDAAMIALAWTTGMRRSEIANLRVSDMRKIEDGIIEIKTVGKRKKSNTVYIDNGAAAAMEDWLSIRGDEPGVVFCFIRKDGKVFVSENPIYIQSMDYILKKRIAQAKIKPITWHDFRRSLVGNLLSSGVDIVTVQRLVNHSSPLVTARYDRRPDLEKRKAIKFLHVPYCRRIMEVA